jgi:hypothetical protein
LEFLSERIGGGLLLRLATVEVENFSSSVEEGTLGRRSNRKELNET